MKQDITRDEKGRLVKGAKLNPMGRPKKGTAISDLLAEYLHAKDEEFDIQRKHLFVAKLFTKAMEGDTTAMKLVFAYTDGLPTQKIEQTLESISTHPEWIQVRALILNVFNKYPKLKEEFSDGYQLLDERPDVGE